MKLLSAQMLMSREMQLARTDTSYNLFLSKKKKRKENWWILLQWTDLKQKQDLFPVSVLIEGNQDLSVLATLMLGKESSVNLSYNTYQLT